MEDLEAEEVFGDIDEEREREDFESLAKCNKRNGIRVKTFKQPQTSVILINDSSELVESFKKQENGEVRFSLGMDDWMEESNLGENKENSKPNNLEGKLQSSFIPEKSVQKGSFSLGTLIKILLSGLHSVT